MPHALTVRYRRGTATECYNRACFAIPGTVSVPEEQQEEVLDALRTLAQIVYQDETGDLDDTLFATHVRNASEASPVPLLKGAFLGILAELRVLPVEDVTAELGRYAQSPPDIMLQAGEFLDGLLAVSRTSIILGADGLIQAIEDLLQAAERESFLTMLPRIRAAFERLSEHNRQAIAQRVAERHGLKETEQLTDLSTSSATALLIAEIDQQVHHAIE